MLYFGHGDGTWPAGKPGFLFWLEIDQADGSKLRIVSNQQWQAMVCCAWKPGQYKRWFLRALQEEFDARLYPHGWSEPSYKPGPDWLAAMPLGARRINRRFLRIYVEYATGVRTGPPESELRPRSVPILLEPEVPATRLAESVWIDWLRPAEVYFECRTPQAFRVERRNSAIETAPGLWRATLDGKRAAALTFEFAEQIVGWPYFTIEAPEGTVVELMSQEGHEIGGAPLLNTHFDD